MSELIIKHLEDFNQTQSIDALFELSRIYTQYPNVSNMFLKIAKLHSTDVNIKDKILIERELQKLNVNLLEKDEVSLEYKLFLPDTPNDECNMILSNLSTTLSKFPNQRVFEIKSSEDTWYPLNPSIIRLENGNYVCISRMVNYWNHGTYFDIHHPEKVIISRNMCLRINSNFTKFQSSEILDLSETRKYRKPYLGFEDCRVYMSSDKQIKFTATTWDTHPENCASISVCNLNYDFHVDKLYKCPTNSNRNEKNWLPFVYNNEDCAIYWYSPLTIIRLSDMKVIFTKQFSMNLSRLRGGAGPIPFDREKEKGWLCIVHDKILKGSTFVYFTRLCWFSYDFENICISKAFTLIKVGIEFVSGICYGKDNTLILSLGIDDREAFLCKVQIDDVRQALDDGFTFS